MSEIAKNDIEGLFQKIRIMNQNGDQWSQDVAVALAPIYNMSWEKIHDFALKVYAKFENEHNAKNGSVIQKIEMFFGDHYEFKRNIISGELLWKKHGQQWTTCKYNDAWRMLQHNLRYFGDIKKTKIGISDVSNLLESSFVPEYNPFKEYFENLPEWDNIDHIAALADHIKCEDQEFWLQMFRKALVRMIACSYGGHENRIICVFVQEQQEQGKDTFIRFLCPPEFHNYYKEDPLEVNKDAEIALTKNFIWNLSELDHLNKKEISEIKSIISRKVINQRAAYSRQAESRSRVVNWWGSTNKTEFLTDDAHTRWLCFNIKSISWAYSKAIDIRKVWAQAWHLYKTGFDYNLNHDEKTTRDTRNKEFEVMPDEKQLILLHFTKCNANEGEFITNVEIQQFLSAVTSNRIRLSGFNVKKSMDQLGFAKETRTIGQAKLRGYWVKKKPMANATGYQNNGHEVPNQIPLPIDVPF